MEQGCELGPGEVPQHPWLLTQPLCSRCIRAEPSWLQWSSTISLLLRPGEPRLLPGFQQQGSDAGLELLLGSLPALLSLEWGAAPSHPDSPSLTFPRQIFTEFSPLSCKARGQGWQAAVAQPDLPELLPFL